VLRLLIFPLLSAAAFSAPFTQVIAFGDSLSDNGNTFTASGGVYPIAPTTMGRQSSGPVAVEYLAAALGVDLNDRAWAGATTGQGNTWDGGSVSTRTGLPGMTSALEDDLQAGLVVDPDALYLVWGGPNDLLALSSPADAPRVISQAVTNLVTITAILQGLGAQHVIVPGMPDLSVTPRVRFLDTVQPGTAALLQFVSLQFNTSLAAALPGGAKYFDTNSVFLDVYNNPGAYGFENVSTPCAVVGVVCATPSDYLFWDDLHPTSEAHQLLGDAFYTAAIPEPSTWLTVFAGLVIVVIPRLQRIQRPHSRGGVRSIPSRNAAVVASLRRPTRDHSSH
jgi:phospholipase/lecithinase/hemolysin